MIHPTFSIVDNETIKASAAAADSSIDVAGVGGADNSAVVVDSTIGTWRRRRRRRRPGSGCGGRGE
jgi:hypothetical protein